MGQFSWLDCVTGEQIIDNKYRDVYLLVPKEFGGGHIKETCYDGYGRFGGKDVYDLVATWNREWASKNPEFIPECERRPLKEEPWYGLYADLSVREKDVVRKWRESASDNEGCCVEWRWIGIVLSCYDEDSSRIPYPVKVTYDKNAVYEKYNFSPEDPNQGWPKEDAYDDE